MTAATLLQVEELDQTLEQAREAQASEAAAPHLVSSRDRRGPRTPNPSPPAAAPAFRESSDGLTGALELRDVTLRYGGLHAPPALHRLSLSVPAGAKAAVCGRTGGGKSSLLRALARLYPTDGGRMLLDGVDLGALPLRQARAAVRVLPQEAVLLDGSILSNLTAFDARAEPDALLAGTASTTPSSTTAAAPRLGVSEPLPPGGAASPLGADLEAGGGLGAGGGIGAGSGLGAATSSAAELEAEAWRAVESVGMRARLEALPLGLRTHIGAARLSEGERQLLSLCRALVAGGGRGAPRVLLCDEPTSSIDLASDQRVTDALFAQRCTVLVACHRMHQIQRYGAVFIVDGGRCVEKGEPSALLREPTTRLARLWAQAHETEAARAENE